MNNLLRLLGNLLSTHLERRTLSRRFSRLGFKPTVEELEPRCLLQAYSVINTNDSGPGSLRDAINAVDYQGYDSIVFNIPGSGPHTIHLSAQLTPIINPVDIVGGGSAGHPNIDIDGANVASAYSGLEFNISTSTDISSVSGLVIQGFGDEGILLDPLNKSEVEIGNCFIGTDVTGSVAEGNGDCGILTESSSIHVSHCVISGNANNGVEILGSGATGSTISNSLIGTDANGTYAIGNGIAGVDIANGAAAVQILNNVISANQSNGINVSGSSNIVQGNLIGTNAAGTAALGNTLSGIAILGAANNLIGGTTPGTGNLISGNDASGLVIDLTGANDNTAEGNFIGTNPAGTAALGNSVDGVFILNGATNNTIGGTTAGASNVISGNLGKGVEIDVMNTNGNKVQGNFIGTDLTGGYALGNQGTGVLLGNTSGNVIGGTAPGAGNVIAASAFSGIGISAGGGNTVLGNWIGTNAGGQTGLGNTRAGVTISDSSNNIVGGIASGAANTIAFNGGAGVLVGLSSSDTAVGNTIRGNSIYNNADLGINLGANATTNLNFYDNNVGPNNFQNYPVISGVFANPAYTEVVGTLTAGADTIYTLDFYANAEPAAGSNAEGQRYLGSITVDTGSSGVANFDTSALGPSGSDECITATAADPSGNTSEFSPVSTTTSVTSNPVGPLTQGEPATFKATVTGDPSVGMVSFYLGSVALPNQIGTAVNVFSGTATSASDSSLPLGPDTIIAVYSGGTGFNGSQGSLALTVNVAPPAVTSVVVNQDFIPLNGASLNLTTGVATLTTDGNSGFTAGNQIVVAGFTGAQAGFDGTYIIASVSGGQVTYDDPNTVNVSTTTFNAAGYAISANTTSDLLYAATSGTPGSPIGTQRSMVDSIAYTFNTAVNLAAGAVTLGIGTGTTSGETPAAFAPNAVLTPLDGGAIWVVTFASNSNATVTGHSIADGIYTATLNSSLVTAVSGGAVMTTTRPTDTFYRLFGDFAANGRVNSTDSGTLNLSFGLNYLSAAAAGYLDYFDYLGTGRVNSTDSGELNLNFGSFWRGFAATI
jgi:hypothetical protein